MPTALDRAIEQIQAQKDAVRVAEAAVRRLMLAHELDADQADAFLERLNSRFAALDDKQETLVNTGNVASAPSEAQLATLRAKVDALRNLNVTQASIEGIVAGAFELAAAVGVTAPASAPAAADARDAADAPAAADASAAADAAKPLTGAWVGLAAAIAVTAALIIATRPSRRDHDGRNNR